MKTGRKECSWHQLVFGDRLKTKGNLLEKTGSNEYWAIHTTLGTSVLAYRPRPASSLPPFVHAALTLSSLLSLLLPQPNLEQPVQLEPRVRVTCWTGL